MSSGLGVSMAHQKKHLIESYGSAISVGSVATFAKRKPIALNTLSQYFPNRDGGAPIIDPAVYEVPALAFPVKPLSGALLVWEGLNYQVHRVDPHPVADVMVTYNLVACRALLIAAAGASAAEIAPAEYVHLWTPTNQSSRILEDRSVADAAFTDQGKIIVFFAPMNDDDKYAAFGGLDVRAYRVFTSAPLKKGAILVRADGSGWVADNASEDFPNTGDLRAMVKHLGALPANIIF